MNYTVLGDEGDNFYVLVSGKASVYVNGSAVGLIPEGSSFGELALLYNTPRTATIRSDTLCTVFALDRETFRSAVAHSNAEKR